MVVSNNKTDLVKPAFIVTELWLGNLFAFLFFLVTSPNKFFKTFSYIYIYIYTFDYDEYELPGSSPILHTIPVEMIGNR